MPASESLTETPDTELNDVNDVQPNDPPAQENDSTADSSTVDQDSKDPETVLDAINKALGDSEGEEESSTSTTGEDNPQEGDAKDKKAKSEEEEEELSEEIPDEELEAYPDKTRKRIESLLDKVKTTSNERDQYRDGYERFVAIQQYAEHNNLENEEVKKGFTIMALMKNDPIEAYNQLKPYMDTLEELIGVKIPPELQSQVEDGTITLEHAQQLSRAQSESAISRRQTELAKEAADRRSTQTQQTQFQADVMGAISKWETNWRKTDPDYKVKQQFVNNAVAAKLAGGYPIKSAGDAVKLAEDCKKEVEEAYKRARGNAPAPQPDDIVQSDASMNKTTPKPTSTMDVIDGVLSAS